ncbi:hypothetical protein [Sphingobacterium multivorum]|uniref:hypothetical protein n=1 Tax=Sphingobacterium multivorum TaxID=28454 RepID=UPI0028A801D8|nr:hypothetical protein [Sphingobacterium multivorum]
MKKNAIVMAIICYIVMMACNETVKTKNEVTSQDSCITDSIGRDNFLKANASLPKVISLTKGTLSVTLHVGNFKAYNSTLLSKEIADKAMVLASQILNSKEFQDEVNNLDFAYKNHCTSCGGKRESRKERIEGKTVLDSLYRNADVTLDLTIQAGRCGGALGATCPNTRHISSNYKSISCDMRNLPIELAYAVHICHEFAHTVGYCHTDHKDDVAEKIGWIAYYMAIKMNTKLSNG